MMEENTDRIIEQYLSGNLREEELEQFKNTLKSDQRLARRVKDLQAIESGLHALGMDHLMQDMKKWEKDIKLSQPPVTAWKKYLAVAAVITLILVPAVYFFTSKSPTSEELFLAYYEPYEEMLISRSNTSDSLGILLAAGLDAYNRGAYQRCTDLLKSYLQQQPEAYRVALYLGIAQLEIDQKQSAEKNFLLAQNDPAFEQQAQWYQALSYLKFGEIPKARDILQSISTSESHYRKDQASDLLKDLH